MYTIEKIDIVLIYISLFICLCGDVIAVLFYKSLDTPLLVIPIVIYTAYLLFKLKQISAEEYTEMKHDYETQSICLKDRVGQVKILPLNLLESVKIHRGIVAKGVNLAKISFYTKQQGIINVTVSARNIKQIQEIFSDYVSIEIKDSIFF